jgi:octaprenyl-diphosphate synthase
MNALKDRLLTAVSTDIQAIETALKDNLQPYLSVVSHVADYLIAGGGKRIRPLLMLLSARLCDYKGRFDVTLSVVFEYLHVATLLHDDVVDGAEVRRGYPVAHGIWGSPATVLVGDYLLARAINIAAQTGQTSIIDVISRATGHMSEGEIYQLLHRGDINLTEEQYMDIIGRKTACLIQAACHTGALLAGAPEHRVQALAAYGNHLGYAFQLIDDLLDYTADPAILGKSTGTDLKEGKMTLPLIYAMKQAGNKDRKHMESLIGTTDPTMDRFKATLKLVNDYGGIAYTRNLAKEHLATAKSRLEVFDTSSTRTILEDLADYVLTRQV